jgi:hypothetical protein
MPTPQSYSVSLTPRATDMPSLVDALSDTQNRFLQWHSLCGETLSERDDAILFDFFHTRRRISL